MKFCPNCASERTDETRQDEKKKQDELRKAERQDNIQKEEVNCDKKSHEPK